jgi:hypothetical protein
VAASADTKRVERPKRRAKIGFQSVRLRANGVGVTGDPNAQFERKPREATKLRPA